MSKKRNQQVESKIRRTKSWQRQPEFDNLLADTDISGLRFLRLKYEKQLNEFRTTNDLNYIDNFSEYKEIQQRYKMINDELLHRTEDTWASPTYKHQIKSSFDSDKGVAYNEDGVPICTVDYNEDETGFILRDLEGVIVDIDEWTNNTERNSKSSRREGYKDWKYYNDET